VTHGFVLGVSEDNSSELVPLCVVENCCIPSIRYVELGVHVLEYVAAAAEVTIVVVSSVEVMNGSIDSLIRYSRVGCAHVLSY